MAPASKLELGDWHEGDSDRRADHEDYTLKILIDSGLSDLIREQITESYGVQPEDIASLVLGRAPNDEVKQRFVVDGRDWMPVLRQCVSSELDADRMDYLLRDSYYAGVPYGRYDHEWLVENLSPVEEEGRIFLGLDARASFSFDDFLISRYHMFTSVYLHQIPIGYEVMLRQYFKEQTGEFVVPTDIEGYLRCDDIYLWGVLRGSENPWAKRVVERRAYRLLIESKKFEGPHEREEGEFDIDSVEKMLGENGIHVLTHSAKGELSKYYRMDASPDSALDPTVYIVDGGKRTPVANYGPLYERYAGAVRLRRLYVEPDKLGEAKRLLKR
jgi:HD superfamily phosphohydrolase